MNTKKLFNLLWVSIGTLVFVSCSEKEDLPDTPPVNDIYINPSAPQGHIKVEALKSCTEPFLGSGYDIMGDYISNYSVKSPILDLSKIDDDRISYINGASGEGDSFIGRNMKEFLLSMNQFKKFTVPTENKEDLLFTATITNHEYFKETYDYSSQYTFAFSSSGAKIVLQRLLTLNPKWDSWLTDEFRQMLDQSSPEEVVQEFGTHVLVNARLGYIIRTLYRSVVADNENNLLRTADTGKGALQNTIFKYPNVSITYPEEIAKKNYGGTIVISFQGADYKSLPHLQLTPNGVIGDPMNVKPWMKTSNEENYALTTLSGDDLIPIYDVITDPVKKQQIKEAVVAHIKTHQLSLQQTTPILQATNGEYYRYYTSYKKLSENADNCQGVIASAFTRHESGTIPLYQSSNRGNTRLSLTSPEGGTIIGYIYESKNDKSDIIYEISNGKSFAYTREVKDSYSEKGTWKPTGKMFYTPKV